MGNGQWPDLAGADVCCVAMLGFARVWEEDDMMGVGQAWCWGGELHPILYGTVGRSRVFGRVGCILALLRGKVATGFHGMRERHFEEQRVAIGAMLSLSLWKGLQNRVFLMVSQSICG